MALVTEVRNTSMGDLAELQAKEECRHSCDTPPCFNPAHLLEGTRQDNIDDMMRRGRHWAQKRKQVLDLAARVG